MLVAGLLVAAACSSESGVSVSTSAVPDGTEAPATTPVASDTESETSDASTSSAEPSPSEPVFGPIEWEEYDDAIDVGTLEVPVDYSRPDGEQFELFLARFNALDQDRKIGSLLINPGGPGFGGTDYAFLAAQLFDRALLERFDIIGWDPRGTGESDPAIDCIDDYDPYFTEIDSTPETEAERAELVAKSEDFARQCIGANASIIQYVGTNNSARDIDAIRQALGEDQISFFGFSYGSELGATWATLFPDTVRAAVLDGAADPNADALESSLQQMAGFHASLQTFLDRCAADPGCEFHNDGDAVGAFVALMDELDANPVPAEDGRPPVNRDVATTAVIQAMYSEAYWPALERSLAEAQQGNGSGLLALHDSYYQRRFDGTYGNELEAFQVITCADTAERKSVAEVDAESALFREVAPLLVPEGSVGGYFCTFLPEALDPRIEITAAGAGPIVVIGTTGDPATPFESTVRMAETLEDGRLVVVEADQHTGYGVNRCVIEIVNDYLIDLEAPEHGTECR